MFGLLGLETLARVVGVTDGDTLQVVMQVPTEGSEALCTRGGCYRFIVRLNGIDTCEIKSKQADTARQALCARARLAELVTRGKLQGCSDKARIKRFLNENVCLVWLRCGCLDRYGRTLAEVWAQKGDEESFSNRLLREGLAFQYFGKTKLTEAQQTECINRRVVDNLQA